MDTPRQLKEEEKRSLSENIKSHYLILVSFGVLRSVRFGWKPPFHITLRERTYYLVELISDAAADP